MTCSAPASLRTVSALVLGLILLVGCGGGNTGGQTNAGGDPPQETTRRPSADRSLLLDEGGVEPARPRMSLYEAVIADDGQGILQEVKANLYWGVSPDEPAPNGFAPLHYAAQARNPEIIALLLQFGADPNLVANPDVENATPLLWAIRFGCNDCVKLLVEHDADVNKPGGIDDQFTPLGLAARKGNREIAEYLVRHGARE